MAKGKRGGARKGAGRKPAGLAARDAVLPQVRVTAVEAATLATRAAERLQSQAEAIREALRADGLID